MAQGRFERPTCCLGGSRSIHLSYWVAVRYGLPAMDPARVILNDSIIKTELCQRSV